jgi:hypothetical protein
MEKKIYVYDNKNSNQFSKTMSHVTLGERVYVKDTDMFGDVTRTTVLGVDAVSLIDDEGTTKAFFGTTAETGIVPKTTGVDGTGAQVTVPVDVKEEGIEVLTAMNITPEEQHLMFVKFMGMFDQQTRRQYMEDWVTKKDDPVQREAFVQGLMHDLDDDTAFIMAVGNQALAAVEPEVRQYMFQRMLTTLSKEERESLIIEWMQVKNYPLKKEEFLQSMYELLMDDDDYIALEGRKAFTKLRILADDQTEIFTQFMANVSAEDRASYVVEYRKVRTSESEKKKLLEQLIKLARGLTGR